ncbi:hypothetical protein CDD83_6200 [Cordyceps sp. RAO-2017]|nr:hypothetical protein CDD83_6200 [Cordyceps sp. RAO-2017]
MSSRSSPSASGRMKAAGMAVARRQLAWHGWMTMVSPGRWSTSRYGMPSLSSLSGKKNSARWRMNWEQPWRRPRALSATSTAVAGTTIQILRPRYRWLSEASRKSSAWIWKVAPKCGPLSYT